MGSLSAHRTPRPAHRTGQTSRRYPRLVTDTGIHALGWTRDASIEALEEAGVPHTDAVIEIDRYIAMPGQALSYKLGELTIRRLRAEAERELGTKFDLRGFHSTLLAMGAVPLPVLETRMRAWIAAAKAK